LPIFSIEFMPAPERNSGVFSPVIMPFRQNLEVDPERLICQCRWLLSQQVGIAVFGTNSEANSLSVGEKIDLLDQLVEAGIDPLRLMPGSGLCALADTVKLTRHIADLGCSGALMLPPFYYKEVTDEGLYRSYAEVIERVGSERLRIYLYHIPPVSQIGISIELIERLLNTYPNVVVGIKDSSGDWQNTRTMLDAGWDDFRIFAGSENFLLQTMQAGGAGCISATANINPARICDLYRNWQLPTAASVQDKLRELRQCVQRYPVIPALKSIVSHYSGDPEWLRVRPPLIELAADQRGKLVGELGALRFNMPGLAGNV
jgi:4-hydroxy-tetrahydrodipicolinate synthase